MHSGLSHWDVLLRPSRRRGPKPEDFSIVSKYISLDLYHHIFGTSSRSIRQDLIARIYLKLPVLVYTAKRIGPIVVGQFRRSV